MPLFSYKAVTATGETRMGSMEAPSEANVIELLSAESLIPLEIQAGAAKRQKTKKLASGNGKINHKKITQDETFALTQQLASMLKSGLPLDRTLSILIEISEQAKINHLLQTIQSQVRGGKRFGDTLADTGQFSRFYVNMVRAGEAGGSIGDALIRLSDYLFRAKELRAIVTSAMIYPAILFGVAVISIIALLTFVVPQFAQMFEDMGGELPAITTFVLGAGEFFTSNWWMILGGSLFILMLFQFILSNPQARTSLDRQLLHFPLVGELIKKIEMARFSRSLSTLLHNGVPLLNALAIVKNTIGNRIMSHAIEEAADNLKQGQSLTQSLLEKRLFPAYALHMLRVGEETGKMESLLSDIADIYDQEVKTSIKQLLALLEPLLILVMALAILIIIGAVLLPMINMADLVE